MDVQSFKIKPNYLFMSTYKTVMSSDVKSCHNVYFFCGLTTESVTLSAYVIL